MKSYPSYDALAIDLDLHFFDKVSILKNAGNKCYDGNGSWFVVTDDGHCHLFDENGNLDDISKLHIIRKQHVRKDIKKIIIPGSVISIGESAFFRCSRLKSVIIPNAVKNIGNWAFGGCSSLTSVVIPNSVTNIGDNAFWGCIRLTSVTIPDSVMNIGNDVFWNCINLMSVTISDLIMFIGGYDAFYNCKNLKNIFFKGKTLKQVKAMKYYPWKIKDEGIIKAELN